MEVNCKQHITEEDCYKYTTNCRWLKNRCERRPGVLAGDRFEGPVYYKDFPNLPIDELVNEMTQLTPKEVVELNEELFWKYPIPRKNYIYHPSSAYQIALMGFEYSEYNPQKDKDMLFPDYGTLFSFVPSHLFYHTLLTYVPSQMYYDYMYIRLLEFLDKSNEYCKTLQFIEIGDPEPLEKFSILGKETPIEYFKEVIRRCSNGQPRTKNILVPLTIRSKDRWGHRNTLIVTPDDKVYRLEPNHKNKSDEIETILIRYFKDSGYKYSSHFKPEIPARFCDHGGFCNVLAVLHYFIDITEASQVKKMLVDYFKWEYKHIYGKTFVYLKDPLHDIINLYSTLLNKNKDFIKLRINNTGDPLVDTFKEFKINGIPSSDIFILKQNDKISFTLQLDSNAEFEFSSKNKVGDTSSVQLTEDQVKFLKDILRGSTNKVVKYTGDINFKNEDGQTPLMIACSETTFLPIIQNLVERGAEINGKDFFGNTPLHFAVERGGATFILKYLLSKGADPNIQNSRGDTPKSIARSPEVKEILSAGNTSFGKSSKRRSKLRSVDSDIKYLKSIK